MKTHFRNIVLVVVAICIVFLTVFGVWPVIKTPVANLVCGNNRIHAGSVLPPRLQVMSVQPTSYELAFDYYSSLPVLKSEAEILAYDNDPAVPSANILTITRIEYLGPTGEKENPKFFVGSYYPTKLPGFSVQNYDVESTFKLGDGVWYRMEVCFVDNEVRLWSTHEPGSTP